MCPFNVTKDDAEELLWHTRKAFDMVEDPILLKVAYAVFRTHLAANEKWHLSGAQPISRVRSSVG